MRTFTERYNNAGVAMTPVQRTSTTKVNKGQWEVSTHRGKRKQVVLLDANQYAVEMLRDAFPKARIRRVYSR